MSCLGEVLQLVNHWKGDQKFYFLFFKEIFDYSLESFKNRFRKGRMAYVVDLDEEDNDLPTTRLRSVHDCPANENSQDINTNNLLIQVENFSCDFFFRSVW